MNVTVEFEQEGKIVESLTVDAGDGDAIALVSHRIAALLGCEPEDVAEDVHSQLASEQDRGHNRHIRQGLVCIDLHFETEVAQRRFPIHARWFRVHRWGCKQFDIAADACANLELRDGAPDGPALNEQQPIGPFPGCHTVWLVRPGPEPNGER